MANTIIFITFRSNQLLLCLLFLIDSLQTIQITDFQQTQDHFYAVKFYFKVMSVHLLEKKNKYKIIVYVHIFSWNTLSQGRKPNLEN